MTIPDQKKVKKIILVGEPSVGKTSIRQRYMGKGFNSTYMATIGADFSFVHGNEINFSIWDIAGERNYGEIRKQFYSGTSGIIFVFDITRPLTFDKFENWYREITDQVTYKIPLIFVGNKEDLREIEETVISEDVVTSGIQEWEEKLEETIPILYSSAKTGLNIESLFDKLVVMIKKHEQ